MSSTPADLEAAGKKTTHEVLLDNTTHRAAPGISPPSPEAEGNHHPTTQAIARLISGDSSAGSSRQKPSPILFIAVFFGCISPMMFGFTIGFTSPAQDTMSGVPEDGVLPPAYLEVFSKAAFSWYASLLNVGCVAGALSGSVISDRFGRKATLLVTTVPHIAGWLLSSFSSSSTLLMLLRVFIGWGVGIGSAVTPVYIGEISTIGLRGALGAANQLSVTMGICLANLVGTYVFTVEYESATFTEWRNICRFAVGFTLLLLVVAIMPESPRWLAKQGRGQEATAALQRLRTGDCSMEADELLKASSAADSSAFARTASPSLRTYAKSMVIGIGLCLFQQLSGVNAVMMYTANICASAGMTNSNAAALAVMILQVVATGISCLLMERAGRRVLLLCGSFAMAFAQAALSYYYLSEEHGMWGPSWLALTALCLFIVGFSLSMGPIPWLILAEIFPIEVRSSAASIATGVNWSCSFFVCLGFLPLQEAISKQGTFLLFAVICGLAFLFIMILVPETQGKTVDEVLAILQSGARGAAAREAPVIAPVVSMRD